MLVVDKRAWKNSIDSIVLSFCMDMENVNDDDELGVTSIVRVVAA